MTLGENLGYLFGDETTNADSSFFFFLEAETGWSLGGYLRAVDPLSQSFASDEVSPLLGESLGFSESRGHHRPHLQGTCPRIFPPEVLECFLSLERTA